MRRTKIVCTIGPATQDEDAIIRLVDRGMNVARLNMSHGTHQWHTQIIHTIKRINKRPGYAISILLDTRGPEVRTGDLSHALQLSRGDTFTFTVRHEAVYAQNCIEVGYDRFIDDIAVGDEILVDQGLLRFSVTKKTKTDAVCRVVDGGTLHSRRHLSIAGKPMSLPSLSKGDWDDIDFAIQYGVDFIALSFVHTPGVIGRVRAHLEKKSVSIGIIAKIESTKAVANIEKIMQVADGVMVARGDLGAETALEEVPLVQARIVRLGNTYNKPVIVATHLLESMVTNPTPTRAEVADIAHAVREQTDALMLSGETATGRYPIRAVDVMSRVACRIEQELQTVTDVACGPTQDIKQEIARCASLLANNVQPGAILVFTRRGPTASRVARCRPNAPIFAFTNMSSVRRKLNLTRGIYPQLVDFSRDPEKTIQRSLDMIVKRKFVRKGESVVIVSDILAGADMIETIQVRKI